MTSIPESNEPVETWNGSCQCGSVKFTLNMHKPLYEQETVNCNCSICQRNGYLLIYPKDSDLTWHSGKDTLKVFQFASKKVGHRFCPECGTSICCWSDTPGFFEGTTVLNVRTLEDIEIDKLKLKKMDGKAAKL